MSITTIISSVPPEIWSVIGASPLLSAFQQKVHVWITGLSSKVKVLLSMTLAVVGTAVPVLLHWYQVTPELAVGVWGSIFAGMTLFYRFVIQSKFMDDVRQAAATRKADAPAAPQVAPSAEFLG